MRLRALLVIGVVLTLPALASASSQGFTVLNNRAQQGMLMSLTANSGVVEPATTKNASSLVGIIAVDDSAVSLPPEAGKVNVRSDGVAKGLVSTLNGDIKVGDRVGVSSIAGVGAKITSSGWIVGIAQSSLDAKTKDALATSVADGSGKKHTVYVGAVPLVIKVTYYTIASAGDSSNSAVPDTIQSAADSVAGKHASTLALLLSFLLFIVGVIIAGLVVNAAIKGGMLAIARQPLTKSLILRKVMQSVGLALLILSLVIVGSLGILRIF